MMGTIFLHAEDLRAVAVDHSPGEKYGSGKAIKLTVHSGGEYFDVCIFVDEGERGGLEATFEIIAAATDLRSAILGEVTDEQG